MRRPDRLSATARRVGLAAACAAAALVQTGCNGRHEAEEWSYDQRGGTAVLKSAPTSGERLQVELYCRKASGALQLIFTGPPSKRVGPQQVALVSDSLTTRLPAQIGPSAHGARLVAPARADDPVLAAFARTGHMELVLEGRKWPMTAAGAQRFGVERFLAYCAADSTPPPEADRG